MTTQPTENDSSDWKRTKQVKRRILLVVATLVLLFASSSFLSLSAVQELKIKGTLYDSILRNRTLLSDILPPPSYIIESYNEALLMAGPKERDIIEGHATRLKQLQHDYEINQHFWEENLWGMEVLRPLLAEAAGHAREFYRLVNDDLLPALSNDQWNVAKQLVQGPLEEAYRLHRASIDRLVQTLRVQASEVEIRIDSIIERRIWLLLGVDFMVLSLLFILFVQLNDLVFGAGRLRVRTIDQARNVFADLRQKSSKWNLVYLGIIAVSILIIVVSLGVNVAVVRYFSNNMANNRIRYQYLDHLQVVADLGLQATKPGYEAAISKDVERETTRFRALDEQFTAALGALSDAIRRERGVAETASTLVALTEISNRMREVAEEDSKLVVAVKTKGAATIQERIATLNDRATLLNASIAGAIAQIRSTQRQDMDALQQALHRLLQFGAAIVFISILGMAIILVYGRRLTGEMAAIEKEREKFFVEVRNQKFAFDQHCIVVTCDVNGRIAYANEQFTEISGYASDDWPAVYHDIMNPEVHSPEAIDELWRTLERGKIWKGEISLRAKDQSLHWVDSTIVPFMDRHGKPYQYVAFHTDVTDRKNAEDRIRAAMNVKSEFVSMVSHELRTPLTIIKESISIVYDEMAGSINEDQREFLETAKSNVDRLGRLINDVLDYQKLEANYMEFRLSEGDINELIKEVGDGFKLAMHKKGLALGLELEGGLPSIPLDRDKIIQVVTNLMNNAMKFTDAGEVALVTEQLEDGAIKVSVRDQGRGIKAEDMEKLFRAFSQISTGMGRLTGGTGLGLALSKKIVEAHGGEIGVASEYGEGSTFYFTLPAMKEAA